MKPDISPVIVNGEVIDLLRRSHSEKGVFDFTCALDILYSLDQSPLKWNTARFIVNHARHLAISNRLISRAKANQIIVLVVQHIYGDFHQSRLSLELSEKLLDTEPHRNVKGIFIDYFGELVDDWNWPRL